MQLGCAAEPLHGLAGRANSLASFAALCELVQTRPCHLGFLHYEGPTLRTQIATQQKMEH